MNANEKQTLTLPAGNVLTITAAAGVTGLVVRLPQSPGGGDAQSVTPIAGANLTFGPYALPERFNIVCTAGTITLSIAAYDPASDATDAEVTAALAALLATSLSGSDATHAPTAKAVYDALALKANLIAPAFVSVGLPEKPPVNATPTKLTLPVEDLAILEAGDTVGFEEDTFTKVSSDPAAGDFIDAAGLAALIDALEAWTGSVNEGAVSAVSVALGAAENGKVATITHLGATTSGGSEVDKATATIAAAEIARLAVGDQVTFDGSTFTKAAATSVPANEFDDTSGLISCIDGMTAWTAAASGGNIKVDAAENGEASNNKVINLIYYRASAGAVNGTVGIINEICADADYIYHCVGANTVTGANWRRIERGSAY